MTAPMLDDDTRHATPEGPRRRRSLRVLAVAALALVAAATGVGLALASRPTPAPGGQHRPAVAGPAANLPGAAGTPAAQGTAARQQGQATPARPAPAARPVLADGSYDGYVRGVDTARRTVTVDLVQVFQGEAAAKAAAQDGQAGWVADWWVRNQNPRLRTLPVAAALQVRFFRTCDGAGTGPTALGEVGQRAARYQRLFYYHFTVAHGAVQRMEERLTAPAC